MEVLRGIVIVVHLIGFALLLGPWAALAFNRRLYISTTMQWGLAIALVTGLALAAPWGLENPLNYAKVGTKLVILLLIGAALGIAAARQKQHGQAPAALFWTVGILTTTNATIAVLV
ncbi:MAG: hypothetical protein Q4D96_10985 [Propionibacteriaceae bacterium]|nr:hypothetical protein [Propionibacteriaceae bacterium]